MNLYALCSFRFLGTKNVEDFIFWKEKKKEEKLGKADAG